MLDTLKNLNPALRFYSIHDPAFRRYGRVLTGLPTSELVRAASALEMPAEGSKYKAEIPALMQTGDAECVGRMFFGETDFELGACWGHNSKLNALEYHTCSELNVAVTGFVLLLGDLRDIEAGEYDAGKVEAFYVEQGAAIEVYATTLHFCPCEVSGDGFVCLVGLTRGTNLPLRQPSPDKLLFRRNKWLLCHDANLALIGKGVHPGIHGENYTVNYR